MGDFMDGYKPQNSGSFTGMQQVTVSAIEAVTAKSGRGGFKFTFYKDDPAHPMFKQIYQNKMFDKFITSIVTDLGCNPMELQKACKQGRGSEWIVTQLAGKSGMFDCEYGEENQNGKKYVEPFCKAEIELMEYKAKKNAEKPAYQAQTGYTNNMPTGVTKTQSQAGSYSDYPAEPSNGFTEDIPF